MRAPIGDPQAQRLAAGAIWISAGGFYVVAEILAAQRFAPPYSFAWNFISDLGVTDCGVIIAGRQLCSPLHGLMNAAFITEGIAFLIGALLLLKQLSSKKLGFICCAAAFAAGMTLVGLFPGSFDQLKNGTGIFHVLGGALGLFGGNFALLLSPLAKDFRAPSAIRTFSKLAPIIGLAATVILLIAQLKQTVFIFAPGIWERIGVDAIVLWQIVLGAWFWQRVNQGQSPSA
jgi:hypothetical membrane protein